MKNRKRTGLLPNITIYLVLFLLSLTIITPSYVFAEDTETTVTTILTEKSLRNGPETILNLTLKNTTAEWEDGTDLSDEKKLSLINALQTSDSDQKTQLELIKNELKKTVKSNVHKIDSKKVEIKIPKIVDLSLEKDMKVSIEVPYQSLKEKVTPLPNIEFTIQAQPKAILSGTAFPTMSQTDLANGGKTIDIKLVNAKWKSTVVSNTKIREEFLKSFTWKDSTNIQNELFAKADVSLTNEDKVITIKLPPVSEKFANTLIFQGALGDKVETLGSNTQGFLNPTGSANQQIEIVSVTDQSASISGTAVKANDLDLATEEKTVVVNLKNDTWKDNIALLTANPGINLALPDNRSLDIKKITRDSDTQATIVLNIQTLALKEDQDVTITIPDTMLNIRSSKDENLKISNAFKILAVTAELSGTATPSMGVPDVQKGGKTIIVTLKNAEFRDLSVEEVKGIFSSTLSPWNDINEKDFTIAKNKLTIKLPKPKDNSQISSGATNIKISSALLKGYEQGLKEISLGSVTIGSIATVKSVNNKFDLLDLQSTKKQLTLELTNAKWDKTIEENSSKKSALARALTVKDQTKEWSLVTNAIAKDGVFKVSSDNTLTITIPEVPNYAIIRNQEVFVTVPKTVLAGYNYDIEPKNTADFIVKVPSLNISDMKEFDKVLESGLNAFIGTNSLEKVWVTVPKKKITQISTYVTELNGRSIATIEVESINDVKTIDAALSSPDGEESKSPVKSQNGNRVTFVFDNMKKDSTLTLFAKDSSGKEIEKVVKKLPSGNKKYTEEPKTLLDGQYSLHSLLTNKSLLSNILKYYSLGELRIGTVQEGSGQ